MTIKKDNFKSYLSSLSFIYGPETSKFRHEIFFLLINHNTRNACLRANIAAVRDIAYLLKPNGPKSSLESDLIFAVSLAGNNGWGAIKETHKAKPKSILVRHPRICEKELSTHSETLPSVGIGALLRAINKNKKYLLKRNSFLENLIVFLCGIRFSMWQEAWEKVIKNGTQLYLHNDFDMFSSSALNLMKDKDLGESYCIQHGVPTDEFFPTQANYQLTWGESSFNLYNKPENRNNTKVIISPQFGPRIAFTNKGVKPIEINLISQTHTQIYGTDFFRLIPEFARIAKEIGIQMNILLHPNEVNSNHLYLNQKTRTPPHNCLTQDSSSTPSLVIGYSSTALLDAARNGNYVIGIDFLPQKSLSAWKIVKPPITISSPEELADTWAKLQVSSSFRLEILEKNKKWLTKTFSSLRAE